jgi:outer membrane protein OmpA-like peptidoglycan-associated protein
MFMTRFRVACSLALAVFGLGASVASAQNVPATAPAAVAPPTTAAQATAPDAEPKSSRPAANEPREAPPAGVTPAVSVLFGANSAEISDRAKADLDRVAKTISEQRMPQVELRAFAGGADPADARKVALVRALAVRSYLIDQGVTARIEVGAFAPSRNSRSGERVDVLAPGP